MKSFFSVQTVYLAVTALTIGSVSAQTAETGYQAPIFTLDAVYNKAFTKINFKRYSGKTGRTRSTGSRETNQ